MRLLPCWAAVACGVASTRASSLRLANTFKPGLIEPRYGRILHDAFEARLDSDYTPHPDLNETSAEQLVAKAEDFVRRMTQFLEESDRPEEGESATQ